ncbi:MAG: transglycosylase domain-containing protein [Rhizobacter sp.]|nr:transglycosylase domain-containing protein [Chlorobiales bacterium]
MTPVVSPALPALPPVVKKGLAIVAIVIITLMIIGVLSANFLFQQAMMRVREKLRHDYRLALTTETATLANFRTATLTGVRVDFLDSLSEKKSAGDSLPRRNPPLFTAQRIEASVQVWPLLAGRTLLASLKVDSAFILLSEDEDGTKNYPDLLGRKKKSPDESSDKSDANMQSRQGWSNILSRALTLGFDAVPDELQLTAVSARYEHRRDTLTLIASINKATLKDEKLSASMDVEEWQSTARMNTVLDVRGEVYKSRKAVMIEVTGGNREARGQPNDGLRQPKAFQAPLVQKFFGASVSAETLFVSLSQLNEDQDSLRLGLRLGFRSFNVHHPKIDADTLRIALFESQSTLSVAAKSFRIDVRQATLDRLPFRAAAAIDKNDSLKVDFKLDTDTLASQTLFESLPAAMLSEMKGCKFEGRMQYALSLGIDWKNLDSVALDSRVYAENFRTLSLGGNNNLGKLQSEFEHRTSARGGVRTFLVGPSNPMFVSLQSLPPHVAGAVVSNEDGGFFLHRGFNEGAIAQSIGDNLRKGRFARGGSTISMQLVKNLFLTRSKTLSRKFQEIVIVWILERSGVVDKNRMMEIYLNIIEWGPGVYGLGEAANFYFAKPASQLTLEESLFLGSIIPSPRSFVRAFDEAGHLKPERQDQLRFVAGKMQSRGLTSTATINPDIALSGRAKDFLKITAPPDSMGTDDDE